MVRMMADEQIFLTVFLLYIKKYTTWCPLSQNTIVPTLTVGLTFNVCRVSSVSSTSSLQSQTSIGGTACSRLPRLAVIFPGLLFIPVRGLTIVLRLGSLAATPPSGVVNMVNYREE